MRIVYKVYHDHSYYCKDEKIKCKFCPVKLERKNMKEHMTNECRNVQMLCDYAYIGCSFADIRGRLDLHMSNKKFRKDHVEFLQFKIRNSFDTE